MDITVDWVKKEYFFKGEKVTAEIRPLRNDAMIILLPFIQEETEGKSKDEINLVMVTKSLDLQKVSKDIFIDHVRDIKGVTVNGLPIVDTTILCEEVVFLSLVVQIIGDLIRSSLLTKEEESNLDVPVTL